MKQKNTYSIFKGRRPPEYVVANDAKEVSCRLANLLETLRRIHTLDVLLERLDIIRIRLPQTSETRDSPDTQSRARARDQRHSEPFRLERTGNPRVE